MNSIVKSKFKIAITLITILVLLLLPNKAQASELEFLFRKNPKNIKKEIKQELNLNLKEEEVINP